MKKFLRGNEKRLLSQSYIWNSIGGLLNAGQSALILMVISRTNSEVDSGIFSIAYAIACLALTIGNFGMRNFQVTDVTQKYSFRTYLKSRIITDALMLLVIVFYIYRGRTYLDYSDKKSIIIALLGMSKLIDSIEDVFHARLQNRDRLDVAGKCLTIRYVILITTNIITLLITKDLIISCIASTVISLTFFIYSTFVTYDVVKVDESVSGNSSIFSLYNECIALAIGSFLSLYIANVPKYAIDEVCTESTQAEFNYIFMPVYIINLLNVFIYQPLLPMLARLYKERKMKKFKEQFVRQVFIILGVGLFILMCGYFWGIPLLSILYNTNLASYKESFTILLMGSMFLAVEGYMGAIVTLMRKQNLLLIIYGASSILAAFFSRNMVSKDGVMGASVLYSGLIGIQMVVMTILCIITIYNKNKESRIVRDTDSE